MSESKTRKEYAIDAIEHIVYEIKMFLFCIAELRNNKAIGGMKNVLIESFAIHFRNLYEFFLHTEKINKKKPEIIDENVYYADIFGKPNKSVKPLKEEFNKANKAIAHIDRNRSALKNLTWNTRKIYGIIKPLLIELLKEKQMLESIKDTDLSEIKKHFALIDIEMKNILHDKVDTTSGSVSATSSIIQS